MEVKFKVGCDAKCKIYSSSDEDETVHSVKKR